MRKTSAAQTAAPQQHVDLNNFTIPEAEEIVEQALSDLVWSSDPAQSRALAFLAPAGYEAIVEFCSGDGRSKRRNAPAAAWSPEEDEIRIYFQRIEEGEQSASNAMLRNGDQARTARAAAEEMDDEDEEFDGNSLGNHDAAFTADMDARVKELTAALAEAERGGHAFIALKWFRDSFLPRKAFRWNQRPESRQAVLAEAIQRGVVITSKIPNPKTPAYPTTTIRLNRAEAGLGEEAQRFRPIVIGGEALTASLHEDRGMQ